LLTPVVAKLIGKEVNEDETDESASSWLETCVETVGVDDSKETKEGMYT
jgi:hypothetical protein